MTQYSARSLSICIVLLGVFVTVRPAAADTPGDDTQDLLYIADDGVAVLRLVLRVDGTSCEGAWNDAVDAVLDQLDTDGDQALSTTEVQRFPSGAVLVRSGVLPENRSASTAVLDQDRNGSVTRSELAGYFLEVGLTPFHVTQVDSQSTQQRPARVPRDRAAIRPPVELFARLDADQNGQLSTEEFADAYSHLRKADLDDDETISVDELRPLQNPFVRRRAQIEQLNEPAAPRLLAISSDGSPHQLVIQLLDQHDGRGTAGQATPRDTALSREELPLPAKVFSDADADENGRLDYTELSRFFKDTVPSVELIVRTGARQGDEPIVEVVSPGEGPAASVQSSADVESAIVVGSSQIEFRVDPPSVSLSDRTSNYQALFRQIDRDNNAYLDPLEIERSRELRDSFSHIDADGNGQVVLDELVAFYRLLEAIGRIRTRLNVGAARRSLFERVDSNRDGRISPREFRQASASAVHWDVDGNGQVGESELPAHFLIGLGRSPVSGPGRHGAPGARSTNAILGPSWFWKMDRNGDGDVSRREFLGGGEAFDLLDADHDGLLDANEASAVQ